MIDHIIITVANFERSLEFYNKALKPLNIRMTMDFKGPGNHHDLKGFGDDDTIYFWLKEGEVKSNGVHIGFAAKDHEQVKVFYEAAIAAGGTNKEQPRIFSEYYPGYYVAWILDPDGYEIELVHKS